MNDQITNNNKGKWLIFICLFFYISCSDSEVTPLSLKGKWKIDSAERNKKPTLTLEDAYLDFRDDSLLTTNILRTEMTSAYSIDGTTIIQKDPFEIKYLVESWTKDSLILSSSIRGYEFRFFMSRDSSLISSH